MPKIILSTQSHPEFAKIIEATEERSAEIEKRIQAMEEQVRIMANEDKAQLWRDIHSLMTVSGLSGPDADLSRRRLHIDPELGLLIEREPGDEGPTERLEIDDEDIPEELQEILQKFAEVPGVKIDITRKKRV